MKNVRRENKPTILRDKGEIWTKELLEMIKKCRPSGRKVPARLQNRYKNHEIMDVLRRMYIDPDGICLCCYCESEIDDVGYPNIEHRYPKDPDKYPEKTFEWDNLHLACTKCNCAKGNKWDNVNPILDAVIDNPIGYHLEYYDHGDGVYRDPRTERGKTTVLHADLNRPPLLTSRRRIYGDLRNMIYEIRRLKNNPRVLTRMEIIRRMTRCKHGSLILWALEINGINI